MKTLLCARDKLNSEFNFPITCLLKGICVSHGVKKMRQDAKQAFSPRRLSFAGFSVQLCVEIRVIPIMCHATCNLVICFHFTIFYGNEKRFNTFFLSVSPSSGKTIALISCGFNIDCDLLCALPQQTERSNICPRRSPFASFGLPALNIWCAMAPGASRMKYRRQAQVERPASGLTQNDITFDMFTSISSSTLALSSSYSLLLRLFVFHPTIQHAMSWRTYRVKFHV